MPMAITRFTPLAFQSSRMASQSAMRLSGVSDGRCFQPRKIIPRAVSGDQHVECLEGLAHILLIFVSVHETVATFYVNFYHNVYF